MRRLMVPLLCASLCGCGVMVGMSRSDCPDKVYVGTEVDVAFLADPFASVEVGGGVPALILWPFVLVDLPVCLVTDTVLLPFTIAHDSSLRRHGREFRDGHFEGHPAHHARADFHRPEGRFSGGGPSGWRGSDSRGRRSP